MLELLGLFRIILVATVSVWLRLAEQGSMDSTLKSFVKFDIDFFPDLIRSELADTVGFNRSVCGRNSFIGSNDSNGSVE
jgi:hypothetical protein